MMKIVIVIITIIIRIVIIICNIIYITKEIKEIINIFVSEFPSLLFE